jgi:transcriptional regulator with XRE-family HTH domain
MITTEERLYSPNEICEIFEISKSTLLRWEREKIIPPAKRDIRTDQRQYTEKDFHEIGEQIKKQLRQKFERVTKSGNYEDMKHTFEDLYVARFVTGELTAVAELENFKDLSPSSLKKICKVGFERFEPSSPMFYRLAYLVGDHARALSSNNKDE